MRRNLLIRLMTVVLALMLACGLLPAQAEDVPYAVLVPETAGEAPETPEAVEEQDGIEQFLEMLRSEAEELTGSAVRYAEETANSLREAVIEFRDEVREAVREAWDCLAQRVRECVEDAQQRLEEIRDEVRSFIAQVREEIEAATQEPAEVVIVEEAPAEEVDQVLTPSAAAPGEVAGLPAQDAALPMRHTDYAAAEMDSEVYVETYVQAKQGWWDNKATIYTQSPDGAYFIYNMPISQEDYDKLVPGTQIAVKGYKTEWAGEVEITDATFEILEGDAFIAEPADVTALLGTDELIAHQNELVAFKGMTVEAYDENGAAFAYKDAVGKTDDLYFKVSKDGQTYEFCVEFYLCGQDTDVYKAVEALKVGDVIDLEGFLYWYNGANPHIIAVRTAE